MGSPSSLFIYYAVAITARLRKVDARTLFAPAVNGVARLDEYNGDPRGDYDITQAAGKWLLVDVRMIECARCKHFAVCRDDSPNIRIVVPATIGMAQRHIHRPRAALLVERGHNDFDLASPGDAACQGHHGDDQLVGLARDCLLTTTARFQPL